MTDETCNDIDCVHCSDLPKGVLATDDPCRYRPKTLAELILELGREGIAVEFAPIDDTTRIRMVEIDGARDRRWFLERFVDNRMIEAGKLDVLAAEVEQMWQQFRSPKASTTRAPEEQIEGRGRRIGTLGPDDRPLYD